ncbi:malate/lactate/ureidoglycolate dehydrogenase [Roseomonas soli]|uniref:Malate/lactate/ureidoglycolate dehydrogenase n=1 Tax=Neoroseomonas soli TaxID=1081025 RepID=A0A9X9WYH9_9PROT|nr:malate/lactate/ureidoglycolate dehydrogenase [Neoroseomonas soli]MBR0672208.1 malate/lactate/ureidoglycolate dehydrogenase [Neoroseomonas soli]
MARIVSEAPELKVQAGALRDLVRSVVAATGSTQEEAEEVAAHLLEANLQGHDSHGIMLLPRYVDHVRQGRLHPNVTPKAIRQEASLALFDGGMGYGQRVGRIAMDWAINAAHAHGHAVMGLRDVHHLGRIGTYGEQAAAAGMISVHFVNGVSGPPAVAPFGGSDARLSTNPVCITVPGARAGEAPLVLDFATSAIALGKCRVAFNAGRPVPEGALVDHRGQPTTDPGVLYREGPRGALLSFGAHKGYGLALVCEVLAGALLGGATAWRPDQRNRGIVNSWLAFVLDPARFGDLDGFRQELAAVIDDVKASPPADPENPVLVAGEKERITKAKRLAEGIPVDATTWGNLVAAARSLGIADIPEAR